jgi:hypothetical protein
MLGPGGHLAQRLPQAISLVLLLWFLVACQARTPRSEVGRWVESRWERLAGLFQKPPGRISMGEVAPWGAGSPTNPLTRDCGWPAGRRKTRMASVSWFPRRGKTQELAFKK